MINKSDGPNSVTRIVKRVGLISGAVLMVALGFLFFIPTVEGQNNTDVKTTQVEQKKLQELRKLHAQTVSYKKLTDRWVHRRGASHHTRAHTRTEWTRSLPYAKERARNWKIELYRQKKLTQSWLAEQRKWARANKDFHYAARLAASHYGISYGHIHSCAHSEGHIHGYRYKDGRPQKHRGIDPFQMNHGGSGAGGQMQFMESTFDAYPQARRLIPIKYRKWTSKLAQAYTAAYVFKTEGTSQWTGSGC